MFKNLLFFLIGLFVYSTNTYALTLKNATLLSDIQINNANSAAMFQDLAINHPINPIKSPDKVSLEYFNAHGTISHVDGKINETVLVKGTARTGIKNNTLHDHLYTINYEVCVMSTSFHEQCISNHINLNIEADGLAEVSKVATFPVAFPQRDDYLASIKITITRDHSTMIYEATSSNQIHIS